MRHLPALLAIATLSGCWLAPSLPVVVSMPPDQNVTVPVIPSPTPRVSGAVQTWPRNPIAVARAIEPKNSLLANPLEVELVAGGTYGEKDGTGAEAELAEPFDIVIDPQGSLVAIEHASNVIRKVSSAGVVTTMVGPDGQPVKLNNPTALAADAQGNLFIGEGILGCNIVKVTPDGSVQRMAGDGQMGFKNGRGEEARFKQIVSMTVARDGSVIIAEQGGRLRKMTPDGDVTTYAGEGSSTFRVPDSVEASNAYFPFVGCLAYDPAGRLLIGDVMNASLRYIGADGKLVTTVLGNGSGFVDGALTHAKMSQLSHFAVDSMNNVYIADSGNHAVRRLSRDGVLTTLVGDGYDGKVLGKNDRARLKSAQGLALTPDGTLYIADSGNNRIVRVQLPKQ